MMYWPLHVICDGEHVFSGERNDAAVIPSVGEKIIINKTYMKVEDVVVNYDLRATFVYVRPHGKDR